jgi:hypothetical protein
MGATPLRARRGERGQAAVESALVLPMVVFLVLGTLQLFLMLQARIMAEYAAYRATRAGSVNHGSCAAMEDAAIAALLPTFRRTDSPKALGDAFRKHKNNRYRDFTLWNGKNLDNEHIVWLFREQPLRAAVPAQGDGAGEDVDFDYDFDRQPMLLEVQLVFWYPLRIPFADWVISRMALAHYGIESYAEANPLFVAHEAKWPDGDQVAMASFQRGVVVSHYAGLATSGRYFFPIHATHTMRMMTPAKRRHFQQQHCPDVPTP